MSGFTLHYFTACLATSQFGQKIPEDTAVRIYLDFFCQKKLHPDLELIYKGC